MFAHPMGFPGGLVEEDDACESWLDHRIVAIRERWQEASVLLVHGARGRVSRPPDRPVPEDFRKAVTDSGGKLDLRGLQLFGHWIMPEDAPKRYDTQFYIARAAGADRGPQRGETVALEWIAPHEALMRDRDGIGGVMFPMRLNLLQPSETPGLEQAFSAGAGRRIMAVTPRVEHRDGGPVICIPQEAVYSQWEEPVRTER